MRNMMADGPFDTWQSAADKPRPLQPAGGRHPAAGAKLGATSREPDRVAAAERFVTALFARLEPTPDGTVVTLSVAGEPLPIVVRAARDVHAVAGCERFSGCGERSTVSDSTVDLAAWGHTGVLHRRVLDSAIRCSCSRRGLEVLTQALWAGVANIVDAIHDAIVNAQRNDVAMAGARTICCLRATVVVPRSTRCMPSSGL